MGWMAWTQTTATFFICIAMILVVMSVWELTSPSIERKGFLPMATTRGDRLFIGLLSAAYIHLTFLAITELSLWIALAISITWLLALLRWG
ncbi:MAG: putative small integral membrane protein [Arenicella sp.]|jgi:predicted small integral membrane protein